MFSDFYVLFDIHYFYARTGGDIKLIYLLKSSPAD